MGRNAARAAAAALIVVEILGTLLMWVPIPLAWFWVGARVFDLTGSILADGVAVLAGFVGTVTFLMSLLNRLDRRWIALRRRAGHDQRDGALNQVVIASATFGVLGFWVWFHIIERAFVIPFMPTGG